MEKAKARRAKAVKQRFTYAKVLPLAKNTERIHIAGTIQSDDGPTRRGRLTGAVGAKVGAAKQEDYP